MRHALQAAVLGAGLLLGGAQSRAAAATYTIDFDDLAAGTTLSTQYAASTGATFSAGGGSLYDAQSQGSGAWATNTDLTVVSATGADTNNLGTPSLASGNVLGSYAGWMNEDGDPVFTITFATAITAFSADFAAVEYGSDVAIHAYSGSTLVSEVIGSGYGQFTLSLAGLDITSVVITPGSYGDYVAVDDIAFTTSVPEPANVALLALGLGLVALRRGARRAA
jgi:hypothetical protein